MERIKPIDLERTPIRRVVRGYNRNTVDLLLGRASHTIAELLEVEKNLKAEIAMMKAELEKYRALEATMRDALLVAQKAADDTRALAHKEADMIVEKAKAEAQREKDSQVGNIARLNDEVNALRRDKRTFIDQYRSLLEHHLKELAVFEGQSALPTALTHAVVEEVVPTPNEEEAVR